MSAATSPTGGSPTWVSLVRPSAAPGPESAVVSARGTAVQFADGIDAFCATSGLWNVPLGYGNEAIAEAVGYALREHSYASLFRRGHRYADAASERLLAVTGGRYRRVIYSTSGGAANDAAMKLVRQFHVLRGEPQRRILIALEGSYHGLTAGAHALSGDALDQGRYGVDRRDIRHVRTDDGGAQLRSLIDREGARIAGMILEPVLGTGARVVPDDFLRTVHELRAHHGLLLIADEVATGFGRTGPRFASEMWPEAPDVLVLSKALSNGAAAVAVLLVGARITETFDESDALFVHGETQAGAPPSCAAILAALDEYERLDADGGFRRVSAALDRIEESLADHPRVAGFDGRGCFRAIILRAPSPEGTEPAAAASTTAGAGTAATDALAAAAVRAGWPATARPLLATETGASGDAGDGGAAMMPTVLTLVEGLRQAGVLVQPGPGRLQLVPPAVASAVDMDRLERALHTVLDADIAS